VYESTPTEAVKVTEQYIYGSSRIGVYYAGNNTTNKAHTLGLRHYELTDHLGNVRVVISDFKKEIISATDYYPFGMSARSYVSNDGYRYGFNGKEDDSETGWQDYGFRMYDTNLCRFFSVDPLTKSYPMLTTYQFASNTPIVAIDMDGLEGTWIHVEFNRDLGFSKTTTYYDVNDEIIEKQSVVFGGYLEVDISKEQGILTTASEIIDGVEYPMYPQQYTPPIVIIGTEDLHWSDDAYWEGEDGLIRTLNLTGKLLQNAGSNAKIVGDAAMMAGTAQMAAGFLVAPAVPVSGTLEVTGATTFTLGATFSLIGSSAEVLGEFMQFETTNGYVDGTCLFVEEVVTNSLETVKVPPPAAAVAGQVVSDAAKPTIEELFKPTKPIE
jgi:RHS repeat-associated protein